MKDMKYFQEKDLKYIWHPCSQMKDYEELKPIVIERGEGVWLYDIDGNKYLDCIIILVDELRLGHSKIRKVTMLLKKQIDSIEHVIFPDFSQTTCYRTGGKAGRYNTGHAYESVLF